MTDKKTPRLNHDGNLIRKRVNARLRALMVEKLEPFENEKGLPKNFIWDLVNKRKNSFQARWMPSVAWALECSEDYILGRSTRIGQPPAKKPPHPVTKPRAPRISGPTIYSLPMQKAILKTDGLRVAGECRRGTWREPGAPTDLPPNVQALPDKRYGRFNQVAYVIRPQPDAAITFATAIPYSEFQDASRDLKGGTVAVIERRNGELTETTLRVFDSETEAFSHYGDTSGEDTIGLADIRDRPDEVQIVAIATSLVRLLP